MEERSWLYIWICTNIEKVLGEYLPYFSITQSFFQSSYRCALFEGDGWWNVVLNNISFYRTYGSEYYRELDGNARNAIFQVQKCVQMKYTTNGSFLCSKSFILHWIVRTYTHYSKNGKTKIYVNQNNCRYNSGFIHWQKTCESGGY